MVGTQAVLADYTRVLEMPEAQAEANAQSLRNRGVAIEISMKKLCPRMVEKLQALTLSVPLSLCG